ncbi:alpha-(1,6)-fucosyltransferase [Musca domestica]|uniref:Alpha-(1,6)-fucosyltransferase n=1 Tax=Musca domestica TaxID=7370 RepID=A0A9J7DD75_MUSDO|nr:alpha-(1,6)-fucosyltransferase [Musca domestica]XP_019890967.2 alpha-(1,6)-fucosyltransferase [Musca domestica]XP_019890968.2 alpha-(1,6)-fucosyltransferase [Musca domestica]
MSLLRQFFGTSSNTWVRALIIFCLAWAFLVYIFVTKLNPPSTEEPDNTSKRINQALQLLEASRQRNQELQEMIDTLLNDDRVDKQSAQRLIQKLEYNIKNPLGIESKQDSPVPFGSPSNEPTLEYELLRRRIQTNIAEIWNFFSNELGKIRKQVDPNMKEDINSVLIMGAEHKRSLLSDMERLHQLDGYEAWRHQEAKDLSDLVQRRLRYLQNPPDCGKAKKLVCKLNKGCGYGCQLHHAVYCFIVAYATERTLILKSKGWRYHKGGWEEVFQPVSDSCLDIGPARANNWPGRPESQVVVLPIIDSLMPRPPYLPLAIPEDISFRLKRLHSEPIVWWVGQFLKYLLRPQKGTQEFLENSMAKLGWKKPIVGVHVRRTDKVGTEAAFHSIDEYMTHVEDYYLTQEINGTSMTRRIFLASDDARVIDEARKKYPQYEIIGDAEVARMAAVSTRYTDTGLNGIILDIHLLSISDYLVCTFSSQVCRVAYEIMQTLYPDAGHRFKSLDDIYYYGGQNQHNRQVVIPHKARNHDELHLKPGDLVGVAGNHWDGFSKGKNTRTNQVGLFPSFKVVDKVETAKLPTYPNV